MYAMLHIPAPRHVVDANTIDTPAGPVRPGDVVTYALSTDRTRTVEIHRVYADVKNGKPGFEGYSPDGMGMGPNHLNEKAPNCWGYAAHVLAIGAIDS